LGLHFASKTPSGKLPASSSSPFLNRKIYPLSKTNERKSFSETKVMSMISPSAKTGVEL